MSADASTTVLLRIRMAGHLSPEELTALSRHAEQRGSLDAAVTDLLRTGLQRLHTARATARDTALAATLSHTPRSQHQHS